MIAQKLKELMQRIHSATKGCFPILSPGDFAAVSAYIRELERERDELRAERDGAMESALAVADAWVRRAKDAEAELERRDAAACDPVAWQYRYNDGKVGDWKTVDSDSECNHSPCYERRAIYTTAPPAVLPPEMINDDAPCHYSSEETFAWVAGANWMRQQCLELGAQQQKVVDLPMPFDVAINLTRKSGDIEYIYHEYGENFDRDEILATLDAANVKYEVKK